MENNTKPVGIFPATAMPDADWWQALWPDPGQALADLGVTADTGSAVDLCCGDGLFTASLTHVAQQVIAIDLDPEMLDRARKRVEDTGRPDACEFIKGDAYDVAQMVRQPVDFVLMANTLHGVPDKPRLVQRVAAILKPGGRFIVINWHRRPREATTVLGKPRGPRTDMRMSAEDVTAVAAPAGLRLVRVTELPPYHYAAIYERPTA